MLLLDSMYYRTPRPECPMLQGNVIVLPVVCVTLSRVTSNDGASRRIIFDDMEGAAYMRRENPEHNMKVKYTRAVGTDMVCHGFVRMRDGDVSQRVVPREFLGCEQNLQRQRTCQIKRGFSHGHGPYLEVHHVVNDHLFMRWPDETF